MNDSWTTILKGNERENGLRLVKQVAESIGSILDDTDTTKPQDQSSPWRHDSTVSGGYAGYALFYCYMYLLTQEKSALQKCNVALIHAAHALTEGRWSQSLYGGLTGVGLAIDHIGSVLGGKKLQSFDELTSLNQEIDDFLFAWLQKDQEIFDYDLINGLVGIGVYFLGRLPRSGAADGITQIIRKLASHSTSNGEGICWFTPPAGLPHNQLATFPHGYYNLGLAHGIPGIIAFLSRAHAAGIMQAETERLLRGSVAWLMCHKLPDGEISTFSTVIAPTSSPTSARLAWCYGDVGIAASLMAAGSSLKDNAIRKAALQIASKAATRTLKNSGVIDASFCHGAFGLAHIFNRFYHFTHEQLFLDKALYWHGCGIGMQNPSDAMCGFLFHDANINGEMSWSHSPGLLMGITGIGLVTLAGLSSSVPVWDRLFLLDL
ncbi:lanthionine synthetase C family protein [Rhodanobacter sp. A1T4]|uniref:lanthionine synthetase C family protein n=1 Tax=Rhodanobacter sp. A1T4 TaxID=2723087 RepID=UPI00161FAA06|nr:lanthionine synthetase C family protein [Rhodanobacter sp. A1T4]MBB6249448.1 lantibiotic modifying enzyme [Rhodanobacter sp. A1T4]